MTAAALGTTVELPTLEADVAVRRTPTSSARCSVEIRPGTQSGEQLVAARPRRAAACVAPVAATS